MSSSKGLKETTPVASGKLIVNVFTAPGKTMEGERKQPFGEALDAMTTVAEAEALADRVSRHAVYVTHSHFDHFYDLGILLDRSCHSQSWVLRSPTFKSQTHGSSSTSGRPHPGQAGDYAQRARRPG